MHFVRLRLTIVLLLWSVMTAAPVHAAGSPAGGTGFMPDRATAAVLVGTKGNAIVTGLDINASSLLMNGGINARSWNRTDSDGSSKFDLGVYLGVGLANVFQLQAGHSSVTGFLLRLRSDIPVTPTADSWTEFQKGRYWSITPFVEVPLTAHHGTVFGLGLGRTF
jgi:hypothetical protein